METITTYELKDIRADIAYKKIKCDYIVCIEDAYMNILTYRTCFKENAQTTAQVLRNMIKDNGLIGCEVVMYNAKIREK